MGRIVAIAGGDLSSTRPLNKHAIQLSGKATPRVLFVSTASGDAEGYIENITREYTFLGCEIQALCLVTKSYSDEEMDDVDTDLYDEDESFDDMDESFEEEMMDDNFEE